MERLKALERKVDVHVKRLETEMMDHVDADQVMHAELASGLEAEAAEREEMDDALRELAMDNMERLDTNDREYKDLFDDNAREHRILDQRIKSVNTGLGKVLAQTPTSAFTDGSK